jgi:hypothetical protein
MIYREENPRALAVLARALHASSRATRVRAVAMLSCVDCERRMDWLEQAAEDDSRDVSDTARAVIAWVTPVADPPWPAREECTPDLDPSEPADYEELSAADLREWEYVVEVWRDDALLVGVFLASIHEEDDDHAKCIALGQAIMASTHPGQDRFEPSSAAAFIVGKRHVARRPPARRDRHL